MNKIFFITLLIVLSHPIIFAQTDYENNFLQNYLNIENVFLKLGGDYGTNFFPFLLQDYGGRSRGLSGAFTSVADDIGTIEKNPAGTASLKNTELFVSHTKLMGDVNYNTLAYSMRFNDLAFGFSTRLLYMPFTHFNTWGENAGSGIITNTVITLNFSYNLLRTYDFFGLSLGGNAKLYIYGVPEVIAPEQSRVNVVFDIGLLTRFNFLKGYKTTEKNFSVGLSVKNLGPFVDDEPPPTTASLGISYKPIEVLLISVDFNYLINYSAQTYKNWSVNTGIEWKFTQYSSLLAGFTLKSSPSFSLGINLDFDDFTVTVVYNPDFLDVSKFSVSASLKLGDLGRSNKEINIRKLYAASLKLISEGNYNEAKEQLLQLLKIDPLYTPAKVSLKQCEKQIQTESDLKNIIENNRLQ